MAAQAPLWFPCTVAPSWDDSGLPIGHCACLSAETTSYMSSCVGAQVRANLLDRLETSDSLIWIEAIADVRSVEELAGGTIQLFVCPGRNAPKSRMGPAGCKPTDIILISEEPVEQGVSWPHTQTCTRWPFVNTHIMGSGSAMPGVLESFTILAHFNILKRTEPGQLLDPNKAF